jgi:EmrB/QacA subfamily drug resistance transporter
MTTPTASTTPTQMSHRQILVVFSALGLGMLLAALDQTIVATALPTIVGEIGGIEHLSWVISAYLLTSTASTPLYGKISDLYGRKRVFEAAIIIFLVGSTLSGLSQNMGQLIAFRAIQGLGAGGLITLSLTIVADVVSPRERGRYQGYFGAVFALASVGGPLLGGFFVDNLSWRWVFYINLPLGIAALIVTSAVLNLPFQRQEHKVDYLGAGTLVAGVSALLLVTVWGGSEYEWSSPIIVGLSVAGTALIGVFLWWEQRAAEPIIPPRLFRNRVFSVSSALMFMLGLVMFGAIIFLPVYLQLVHGATATASGLLLVPMMAGVLVSSIGSGRLVVRLGRYRIFPIIGTSLMTFGMFLLTHLQVDTSYLVFGAFITVLGLGMGLCMQNVILATQNAVDPRDLGSATSAVSFFRSMGGAFGTALFGAILSSRLAYWIGELVPGAATAHLDTNKVVGSPAQFRALPTSVQEPVQQAFVHALHTVFLIGTPLAAITVVLALLLRDVKLRGTSAMTARAAEDDPTPVGAVID